MKLFENFDKINKTNTNKLFEYRRRIIEHHNLVELFSDILTEEDNEKKEIALQHLKNNDLSTTPKEFYDSLIKSKHPDMLTAYTISELSNMKLFKVPNMNIGYALKKYKDKGFCELVAVHNNEPNVPKIGKDLIRSAIKNGACYLDHFDGFLSNLYNSVGFVEYKRDKYNPKYDPDGSFASKYDEQDVIYRKHINCT